MEQLPQSTEASSKFVPRVPLIGPALAGAIAALRVTLGDPTASIAIVMPSAVNGTFARRELAFATPFIRVELWTPSELEGGLAEEGLRRAGRVMEPAGWLRATIARIVREDELPGGYHDVLREPGWTAALVSAISALEGGRVGAEVLALLPLPAGLRERARALSHLLAKVKAARDAEKLAGPEDLADAALACATGRWSGPANVARGAILFGDARLSRTTFEVLSAWLAQRPVVRIDPAELAKLAAEPHGLTAAAPHAQVVSISPRAPRIALVQTPDPTRETGEAVREVQAAVERGVPLDRIAIVLPDPAEASSLADALARAAIPATWQTGPALAQAPAARFLLHALELALGDDTVLRWYDLLRQNELRLRSVLGENGTRGRGRWRRLLSKSGAIRGTARIVREVLRLRAEEREDEPPEQRESRLGAIDALHASITALSTELADFAAERSVGAHARVLRSFLRRWWTPSPDQQLLSRLLEGWGRSLRGPAIDLAEMAATLRETLEGTETLSGSLKDASIRVLSPMQLLGAELEVVLVTGMTQGRFPARPREDALLSDRILDVLHAAMPAGIFRSSDRVLLEKRRLAAVRSAAAGVLWLSAPAVDMLEGRPLFPGSLLLDVASEMDEERVGPSELVARMLKVGRRSRSWPHDPLSSLGSLELLLARLHGADHAASESALDALVDHALARRLVRAEWAAGLIERGASDDSLRAHAGFVEPAILACAGLDGTPMKARELLELLDKPEQFLLRRMLGAWRAPILRDGWDPIAAWWVDRTLLEESRTVFERLDDARLRLRQAFDARALTELDRTGVGDSDASARLGRMAQRCVDALMRTEPVTGPIHALANAQIADDLPWRVGGGDARAVGAGLHWIVEAAPGPRSLKSARAELLETAARSFPEQGNATQVAVLEFRDLRGKHTRFDRELPVFISAVLDDVRAATSVARVGFYPATRPDPDTLSRWGLATGPMSQPRSMIDARDAGGEE